MKFSLPMSTPVGQPPELLRPARGSYIALSVMVAALLNLLSMPDLISRVRPDFIALVFIYWTIYHPYRIGFFLVWTLGLVMDVANGSLFGQHALAYTILVYLAGVFHRRVIMFALVYQLFHVGTMLLVAQVVTLALRAIAGSDFPGLTYFLPSVIGAALWPLMTTILRAPLRQGQEQDAS